MNKLNNAYLTAAFTVFLLLCVPPVAKADIPGLIYNDAIDLSPGSDAFDLNMFQLNHASHKLYVTGYPSDYTRNLGLKVIDTTSNHVIGGIDLGRYSGDSNGFRPLGFAIDESAAPLGNKIYMVGSANVVNARLRVIDGETDTNLTGEGTDLFLPVDEFDSVVVNSANHKVYIANDDGAVVVVDGPSRQVLTTLHPNAGNLLLANPVTNKVFIVNHNGGAMIDSSDDTFTSLVLPIYAVDGVVNPDNGLIYFAGTAQSASYQVFAVDGNTGQLVASSQARPGDARSITFDRADNTVRVGTRLLLPTGYYQTTIQAFDGTDLSAKGSLSQGAGKLAFDPGAPNGLFLLPDPSQPAGDLQNMVAALHPSSGAMQKIATGYRPFELTVNNRTNRAYVTDEQTNELLVIDGASHAVISRIPMLGTRAPAGMTPPLVTRFAGISERLNRVYLVRTPEDSSQYPPDQFLDVFDGATNEFRESILLEPGFFYSNLIAIDDARHRIYLHRARSVGTYTAQQFLIAYDTDTQTRVASIDLGVPNLPNTPMGLAVNPVTGRVYDAGGTQGLAIVDGNTDTLVGMVPVSGEIKINWRTNKIFVRTSDGNSSSIAVINGAIDNLQTTFPILSDYYTYRDVDFEVDETTNRVYVAYTWNFHNGGLLKAYNGNDAYQLLGQTDLALSPARIAFSGTARQLFVSNDLDGDFSVFQADDTSIPADLFWNISTRGYVNDGDSALIGGFVISGTQPKTVIVRGIGPSLSMAGALADPIIEVHGPSGELLVTNDNWRDADTAPQIMASGFAPSNDLEPALWGVINPGAYTVIVRGKNATTGVGLFEVYDLDQSVDSKLGNISTRGKVEVGDNVMIAGVIVLGTRSGQVVVRAIGPSLTAAGVPNPLEDPVLELRDTNGGLITVNDNWQEHQAEVIGTSLAPSDPRESAIVASLFPGSYTAIVHGKDGATGVALVEAYYIHQ